MTTIKLLPAFLCHSVFCNSVNVKIKFEKEIKCLGFLVEVSV